MNFRTNIRDKVSCGIYIDDFDGVAELNDNGANTISGNLLSNTYKLKYEKLHSACIHHLSMVIIKYLLLHGTKINVSLRHSN